MKWEQLRAPGSTGFRVKPSDRPRYLSLKALATALTILVALLAVGFALVNRKPAPMVPVVQQAPARPLPPPGTAEYRTPNAIIRFPAQDARTPLR